MHCPPCSHHHLPDMHDLLLGKKRWVGGWMDGGGTGGSNQLSYIWVERRERGAAGGWVEDIRTVAPSPMACTPKILKSLVEKMICGWVGAWVSR